MLFETGKAIAPPVAITLPVCFITSGPIAARLFAYDHQVCFDFEIDTPLLTDIHHHPIDRAGERPGPIAWIVRRDRLAPR